MEQSSGAFAFVVPEKATVVFSEDAFFTKIIHGVAEEFGRQGKQMLLMLAPDQESYRMIERFVTGGHVDGVIIASMHGRDPLPYALVSAGVPFVASGRPLGTQTVPFVDVDNVRAVRDAVTYLLAHGRQNVATITGPLDMDVGERRLEGYLLAIKEEGVTPMVASGTFTRESGAEAMREILKSDAPCDAVFAASDLMALGALDVLRREGIRVPEDVAVIGFDDIDAARFSDPPLTTIRQPVHDMGVTMARQVIALAAGESIGEAVMLPTELVIRESA